MNRSTLVTVALLCAAMDGAGGQIIRPSRTTRPMAWTTAGIGWARQQTICDPVNDACWNFGSAAQYRGSLELPMGDAGSWGFAVTTARVPMAWATQNPTATSCQLCDANVDMMQYLGMLHLSAGGSGNFQQAIDLGVGATQFMNFRKLDGSKLGNGKAVTDFSFAVSYGFGYSLQSWLQLTLGQEFAVMMHKRQTGSPNNSAQQQTLRIGLRIALGGQ